MNNKNKILFVLALLVLVTVSWFLSREAEIEAPLNVSTPDIDYEATDIEAVQTNAEGETEYTLTAKSLSHNNATDKDELVDITMDWQASAEHRYRLTASLTDFNQQEGRVVMSEGFQLLSQDSVKSDTDNQKNLDNDQQQNADSPKTSANSIMITGKSLTANTNTKQVKTTEPLTFQQGDNQFTAQGMTANLATGDYEFDHIEIEFQPSQRIDKPLF